MIEYPVEASIELVDVVIRKNVGLGEGHVAAVVRNDLRASEGVGFSKARRTARNK